MYQYTVYILMFEVLMMWPSADRRYKIEAYNQ